jgi:hypothetical protein
MIKPELWRRRLPKDYTRRDELGIAALQYRSVGLLAHGTMLASVSSGLIKWLRRGG